ncbi:MAG TPA: hypothetical protein VEL76_10015 [Gemmataceae bacterium]|nr:hypothetical protein [Gemmataceae bacterium]
MTIPDTDALTGLIIGKFMPPHHGHLHLIAAAQRRVGRLTVLLCSRPGEAIPGDLRLRWLEELCPEAYVLHLAHDLPIDYADPAVWDLWIAAIRRLYPAGPDFVFSSEDYGAELARRLGAEHALIDRKRARVPVSGTQIRERPFDCWDFIPDCVRPYFLGRAAPRTGTAE